MSSQVTKRVYSRIIPNVMFSGTRICNTFDDECVSGIEPREIKPKYSKFVFIRY